MKTLSIRSAYALGALACGAILAVAFYLQYVEDMEPCPLCWFQRLAVLGLAVVFALGAAKAWRLRGQAWVAGVGALIALSGMGVAGRHIWIQNLPADQVPACGQGIGFMLDTLPFLDVLAKALKGSGECAKRDVFLGFTLPSWTMLFFVGCLAFLIWQLRRRRRLVY